MAHVISSDVQAVQVAKLAKGARTDHRSPAELELEKIERSLTTVVVGLEILTGICAGVEDSDIDPEAEVEEAEGESLRCRREVGSSIDDVDEDMEEDDDLADEDLIEMGRDPASAHSASQATVSTAVTLSHLLTTLSLPARLTSLSTLNSLSFPPSSSTPSLHPPTTSLLSVLHLRALETLNNLLVTVVASLPADGSASQISSMVPVDKIWTSMFSTVDLLVSEPQALSQKGQELRMEVLEMSLGCSWGSAKISSEAIVHYSPGIVDETDKQGVTQSQVQTLMNAPQALKSDTAKTRCIDTLASIASRPNVSVEENKVSQRLSSGQRVVNADVRQSVVGSSHT